MIIYFLLAGLAVLQAARGRVDQRMKFTIFFLLTTLVAIIGASVMGFYPYGRVRYTPYLILPTIILIGFGGSLVFRWISQGLGLGRSLCSSILWQRLAGNGKLATMIYPSEVKSKERFMGQAQI